MAENIKINWQKRSAEMAFEPHQTTGWFRVSLTRGEEESACTQYRSWPRRVISYLLNFGTGPYTCRSSTLKPTDLKFMHRSPLEARVTRTLTTRLYEGRCEFSWRGSMGDPVNEGRQTEGMSKTSWHRNRYSIKRYVHSVPQCPGKSTHTQ